MGSFLKLILRSLEKLEMVKQRQVKCISQCLKTSFGNKGSPT